MTGTCNISDYTRRESLSVIKSPGPIPVCIDLITGQPYWHELTNVIKINLTLI